MPFVKSKYKVIEKQENPDYVPGFSNEETQEVVIQEVSMKLSFGSREGQLKTKTTKQGINSVGEFMGYVPYGCKIVVGSILEKAGNLFSKKDPGYERWLVKHVEKNKIHKILYLEKLD
jgi:hypothetical protein